MAKREGGSESEIQSCTRSAEPREWNTLRVALPCLPAAWRSPNGRGAGQWRRIKHTHRVREGCVPVVDVEVGVAGLGHARGDEGVGHLLERGLIVVAPERVPRVPAHRRRSFGPK